MRSSNNDHSPLAVLSHVFQGLKEALFSQKVIRHDYVLFPLFHKRKPGKKLGIQSHCAPIRHYYCFGPKLERRFAEHNYFERLFERFAFDSSLGRFWIDHNLDFLSNRSGQNISRIEQLHVGNASEWKENLLIKLYIDVVKQVVPCKVQNHANCG